MGAHRHVRSEDREDGSGHWLVHSRLTRIAGTLVALAITISAGCGQTSHDKLEGGPLSPDAHRAQIVAIDAVLFEKGPLRNSDRTQLEQNILTLAEAASADPSNAFAREQSLDLRLLSTMVWSDKVGAPIANSELTRQWRRIRGSLFLDAAWFRKSSADPAQMR